MGGAALYANPRYHRGIAARFHKRYDAIVVGARCAGAATAMLLARSGLSVLVLERGKAGTDTLSTHALMRAAVIQLHRWGVLDAILARGTPIVRRTTFHYGSEVIPVDLKPRDGVEGLVAPRRFVIDAVLVEAARAAGVDFAFGATVVDVVRNGDRITGVVAKLEDGTTEILADRVIGADGMYSTIASLVGAAAYRTAEYTTAVIFSYFDGLGLDGYHWYYNDKVGAGSIQTNDGVCVFAALPPKRFHDDFRTDVAAGHHQVLAECDPDLAARAAAARRTEPFRGFGGRKGYVRQSYGPGWALIGDAAYFKDPLTAHGMTDALVDAEFLARAIAAGTDAALEAYQHERDARTLTFFELTDQIASFTWDLTTVPAIHRKMSEQMKHEANAVLALR
jgi:2-polyprenyl-6-methoxyphenol hydroxylase-like FAD-dependent oxidoreductase